MKKLPLLDTLLLSVSVAFFLMGLSHLFQFFGENTLDKLDIYMLFMLSSGCFLSFVYRKKMRSEEDKSA